MSRANLEEAPAFELGHFLPYLLNQAAERTGKRFEPNYSQTHGLSRTQWRILAHLGCYGGMTAAAVARRSHTEKSKISRALAGLDAEGLVARSQASDDLRSELLTLTERGRTVFAAIASHAERFDQSLRMRLGEARAREFEEMLHTLIAGE